MPFKQGQSGNPQGRPPGGTSVAEYVRAKAGTDGRRYVDLLDSIAMDPKQPTKTRVDAAKTLLSRGFGTAPQQVDIAVQQTISAAEIRRLLEDENLLDDRVGSVSADAEPASEKRLQDWINGDWPPSE
jgi:hypothetical protein